MLIRLDDQKNADYFYKLYNGKCFSSLEVIFSLLLPLSSKTRKTVLHILNCLSPCKQEETCRMFFTVDIQYTGSIEHTQPSPASSTEPPSCPVCLGSVF